MSARCAPSATRRPSVRGQGDANVASDRADGIGLWARSRRSLMTAKTASKRAIARADILDPALYAKERRELKRKLTEVKRHRRVEVGPAATFYFENYETMWHQVHEMQY